MRVVAIVVYLLLVAGCVVPDSIRQGAGGAPVTCETATHDVKAPRLVSIAPIGGKRQAQDTSWVAFEDLHELAWTSSLIVRGHVIKNCGTADDNDGLFKSNFIEVRYLNDNSV